MKAEPKQYFRYTPNQVIAYNLRRARLHKGWSQEEAATRLAPHLGTRWSSASYSLAERSTERPNRIRNFTADEIVAFALTFELPISWFFFPPEVDPAGRLPLVAPPGVAEGREPLTGLLVELLFGNPEAQALLSKRLHDLLKDHPLEMEGPFMRYLDEATGQASRRAIEHAVGELDGWVKKLRELAVYLEEARDSTLPTMESGLQRFINDRYGQLLAEDETEPQPGPDAGSR